MPPCDAMHIVTYLFEIGPTFGEHPLPHSEIEAFQRNTGIELDSWECLTLRRLSVEYLNEQHAARSPQCPPPWKAGKEITPETRKAEVLKASIRNLAEL